MTFIQLDALRRIETCACSLRARYAAQWQRAHLTAPAFAAGVAAVATADLDLLRSAYQVVRGQERVERRWSLVEVGPGQGLGGAPEYTVRDDLHDLDVLRENHVLRVDDDDLDQDLVSPLEEALEEYHHESSDATFEALRCTWKEAASRGGDFDLVHGGRTRIVSVHTEFNRYGEDEQVVDVEDVHSNERTPDGDSVMRNDAGWEAGPDSMWRQRKRRTHLVPSDLQLKADPLSNLAERARLELADQQLRWWIEEAYEALCLDGNIDAAEDLLCTFEDEGRLEYGLLPDEATIVPPGGYAHEHEALIRGTVADLTFVSVDGIHARLHHGRTYRAPFGAGQDRPVWTLAA